LDPADGAPETPGGFRLDANFPNPFNPTTNVRFSVPRRTTVSLTIYNLLGQKVRTLVDEVVDSGTRTVTWGGTDDLGVAQASGTYIYRPQAGDFAQAKKMILLD
jgi:flagellar hook assembly protein FlgD